MTTPGAGIVGHAGALGGGWVLAVLAGAVPACLYLCGLARRAGRTGVPWRRWRTAAFMTGCGLVALALAPPLEEAAASDPAGHMVQHLLLGMYAPVLLVLAAPLTVLLGAATTPTRHRLRAVTRSRVFRTFTNIWVATTLNVGGMYVLYLTSLYALSVRSVPVHHLVHLHVVAAGSLFAWAVAGPDPAPHRPKMPTRLCAVIVGVGAHSFLAKLLYSRAASLPPGVSAGPEDIERAAMWMYYGGHVAEAALVVALFAAWYRRAPRTRGVRSAASSSAASGAG